MGDNDILCVSQATCQKLKYYVPSIASLKTNPKKCFDLFLIYFFRSGSLLFTRETQHSPSKTNVQVETNNEIVLFSSTS